MKSDMVRRVTSNIVVEAMLRRLARVRLYLAAGTPWLDTPAAAVWGTWGVTRLLLFAGMLLGHGYTDPEFYHFAGLFANGHWPYRDFPVEYPPLAMAFILLPALPLLPFAGIAPRPVPAFLAQPVTSLPQPPDMVRYSAYGISFAVEMLLLDSFTLWLVLRSAQGLLRRDVLVLRAGLAYVAFVFLTGAALQKFDLATGTLCLAALYALVTGRAALAGVALALASLVKGFPALALPLFILFLMQSADKEWAFSTLKRGITGPALRSVWRCLVAFGVTLLAPTAVVLIYTSLGRGVAFGVGALWHTLTYHTGRAFELESVWSSIMLAVGWIPGLRPATTFNGRDLSRVVTSPLALPMSLLSTLAIVVAIALVYIGTWRVLAQEGRSDASGERIATIGWATVAVLLAFMVTFRALPTHYLLVIVPLLPLTLFTVHASAREQRVICAVGVCAVAILGQVVAFSTVWDALKLLRPWAVALLLLRNCAWMVVFVAVVTQIWRADTQSDAGKEHVNLGGTFATIGDGDE